MKVAGLIPARIDSSRFPRKMLAEIKGKTLISRTYNAAVNTGLFDEVIVITDSDDIQEEVERIGGKVLRSKQPHDSGTDRISEFADDIHADIMVNIQGDEPFISKEPLERLLQLFEGPGSEATQVASLVKKISDPEDINDPNKVKVVLDLRMHAMYFSRSPIPYLRDDSVKISYFQHIGIYAFRKQALFNFTTWPASPLERAEKLECNRFIENGMPIKMAMTRYDGLAIDVPEDVAKAEAFMEQAGIE